VNLPRGLGHRGKTGDNRGALPGVQIEFGQQIGAEVLDYRPALLIIRCEVLGGASLSSECAKPSRLVECQKLRLQAVELFPKNLPQADSRCPFCVEGA